MTYQPTTHKFVAVLNKKISAGQVMNALAHATAGLAGSYPAPEEMRLDDYTYTEQQEHTAQTSEAELEYWAVVMFGETGKVTALAKKFSLWRG
ncbi:MAG TPA: DUF2000 family protein [Candidatus Saccharimonadales bacterium]|nr:DUF2000 family protein [Candidatus Saccharimonadales bacterium]